MIKNKVLVGILALASIVSVYAQDTAVDEAVVHSNSKAWRDLQQKVDDLATEQLDFLSFGALLEIEAGYDSESDEVDFSLATLEIGLEAEISSWVRAEVLFFYEEGDDPIDVDEAIISIGNIDEFPVFVQVGRMYVPFGNYESFCITDPLTLELGETRETAGLIGFEYAGFSAHFSGFNGDVETDDKNSVNNFTAGLMYSYETDDMFVTLGGSYIYNINDSDSLQDAVADLDDVNNAAGVNAFLTAGFMGFGLSIEYVTATAELAEELAIEPSALSIGLGYECTGSIAVALRYEIADKVEELELPKERYGACIGWTFNATDLGATTLSAEYMHEEYDDNSSNDIVTLQIAFEI